MEGPAKTNQSPPAINLRDLKHGWTAEPTTAIEQLAAGQRFPVDIISTLPSVVMMGLCQVKIGSVCPLAQIVTM